MLCCGAVELEELLVSLISSLCSVAGATVVVGMIGLLSSGEFWSMLDPLMVRFGP